MQRLQRRTQKAVAHATRQAIQHSKRQARFDQVRKDRSNAQQSNYRRQIMDEAKQRRWEDWHLGPLAPVRKDTKYDTRDLPDRYLQNPGKGGNREKARTGRKQAGSMRLLRQPIAQRYKVGDRVCCVAMKGPAKKHRGVISTVTELRPAEKGCLVEGLNMVPTNRKPTELDPNPPKYIQAPIPNSSLLPVRTIHNPYTNIPEDVIIGLTPNQRLLAQSPPIDPSDPFSPTGTARIRATIAERKAQGQKDREENARRTRPGEKNNKNNQKEDEVKEHEIDTLRYEVEARTWTPNLLRAPMPAGVLDELRGKYSRFRTRHDPEYIAEIVKEEKEKAEKAKMEKNGAGGMLASPLSELSLKERAERPRVTKKDQIPNTALLEQIGKTMAERGVSSSRPMVSGNEDVAAAAERWGKDVYVAARERHESLGSERRRGREGKGRYWPVKGWRVKGERRAKRGLIVQDEQGDEEEDDEDDEDDDDDESTVVDKAEERGVPIPPDDGPVCGPARGGGGGTGAMPLEHFR